MGALLKTNCVVPVTFSDMLYLQWLVLKQRNHCKVITARYALQAKKLDRLWAPPTFKMVPPSLSIRQHGWTIEHLKFQAHMFDRHDRV